MKNFSLYFCTPKEVSRTVQIIPSSSRCKSAEYRICHFQICAKIKSCCGQTLDLHTYHIKLARLIRDVFSFDIYHTFRPKFPAQASLIGEERMGDTTMPRCLVELETNTREILRFTITESLIGSHVIFVSATHFHFYLPCTMARAVGAYVISPTRLRKVNFRAKIVNILIL